jgi:outer membrane protein assembly factor BamD
MIFRIIIICLLSISLYSCQKKKEIIYEPQKKISAFKLYEEGFNAFEKNDFFYASKKFSEAELNFENIELAAKSAIMAAYSLYGINFYEDSLKNLENFLKIYPADRNVIYAHFLIAVIYFEQISDEKKDINPLLKAKNKIKFFLDKYPNTDYAIDLKFKNDLIENQLASKEMYIAKYYISIKKWVPAINRLKTIVNEYEKTIFIEEALHRLVEIHYHLGLEEEAKKYASILGYNYNSGDWFKQSYKILNKDYKISKKMKISDKKDKDKKSFIKKIIKIIK